MAKGKAGCGSSCLRHLAKLLTVQIGLEEGDFVQIVSGVDADLTVATGNLGQLYEGAKVTF